MLTLAGTLSEFDWTESAQQESIVQIMHFYGCFQPEAEDFSQKYLLTAEEVSAVLTSEFDAKALNDVLQIKFKRPAGSERSMLTDDPRLEDDGALKDQLLALYDTIGMIQEIVPTSGTKVTLCLGSSEPNFRSRVETLINFRERCSIDGPIYTLGSDRELWPIHEPILVPLLTMRLAEKGIAINASDIDGYFQSMVTKYGGSDAIKHEPRILNAMRAEIYSHFTAMGVIIPTEADMMDVVVESGLKDTPHFKIQAGKRHDGSRANTEDTIIEFDKVYKADHKDATGTKILIISTQPEATYQVEPVKKILTIEKGYETVEIAAKAATNPNPLVMNDSIARKVYSRLERMKALTPTVTVSADGAVTGEIVEAAASTMTHAGRLEKNRAAIASFHRK